MFVTRGSAVTPPPPALKYQQEENNAAAGTLNFSKKKQWAPLSILTMAQESKKVAVLIMCGGIGAHSSLLYPQSVLASTLSLKQAEVMVERLSTGLTAQKLFDKLMTVITGQTTVEPEELSKQIKALAEGDEDLWQTWRAEFLDNLGTAIDLVTNFNFSAFSESATSFLASFAERFAAWELSSLLALGERWLIWTPLVVLPMAWQMSENQKRTDQRNKEAAQLVQSIQVETERKHEEVLKELKRIELKASLVDVVDPSGKMGLKQTISTNREQGQGGNNRSPKSRTKIEHIVKELQKLNPDEAMAELEGHWRLVYGEADLLPRQVAGIVEITDVRQKIITTGNENDSSSLESRALLRLNGIGVVQITIDGSLQHKEAKLSFEKMTFEIMGTNLPLPQLTIPLHTLKPPTSVSWNILYLDQQIRINTVTTNSTATPQLYIFFRSN